MLSPSDLSDLATRAGVPVAIAEHHAPLLALIQAMLRAGSAAPAPAVVPAGFDVHKSYTAAEAADFLGIPKKTVYTIPQDQLRRTEVGMVRQSYRYVGLDLLCYRDKLPPVDWEAVRDEAVRQLMNGASAGPRVRALKVEGTSGRTRVH